MTIIQALLTNHNRPKTKLKKLKGIVIHWTANASAGADATANRNYFNTTKNSVSAHYIVDSYKTLQCIPDDEVAYHVGAKKYTAIGEALREKPYSPNYYTIGIEMCVNSDGDWNKTYKNTVNLVAYLTGKYGLNMTNLYRHYDITGKACPQMFLDMDKWNDFKDAVFSEMTRIKIELNGKQLDISGTIINNSTYVPVRAICEALGKKVTWEQNTRMVKIEG